MNPTAAKTGGLQIQRWQEFAVDDYGFTLAALTLEPSGFRSNRVKSPFRVNLLAFMAAMVLKI